MNGPHTTPSTTTSSSSDTGEYLVPTDPMDELHCDSCQ